MKLHDSRVTTPFFGPNAWVAMAQPVPGGNIPAHHAALELKLTFKDGGAYDFHTKFIQIRERLQQASDVAAETGSRQQGSNAAGVNMDSVHLEQLPAYEEQASEVQAVPSETPALSAVSQHPGAPVSQQEANSRPQPDGPPPGYDEAQSGAIFERLEEESRSQSER